MGHEQTSFKVIENAQLNLISDVKKSKNLNFCPTKKLMGPVHPLIHLSVHLSLVCFVMKLTSLEGASASLIHCSTSNSDILSVKLCYKVSLC